MLPFGEKGCADNGGGPYIEPADCGGAGEGVDESAAPPKTILPALGCARWAIDCGTGRNSSDGRAEDGNEV